MATYEGPQGRIVINPPARRQTMGEELLDWAAEHPGPSLGIALGLGLMAALLMAEDKKARRWGLPFRASRFVAAGLVGQATSFLIQSLRRLVFG